MIVVTERLNDIIRRRRLERAKVDPTFDPDRWDNGERMMQAVKDGRRKEGHFLLHGRPVPIPGYGFK